MCFCSFPYLRTKHSFSSSKKLNKLLPGILWYLMCHKSKGYIILSLLLLHFCIFCQYSVARGDVRGFLLTHSRIVFEIFPSFCLVSCHGWCLPLCNMCLKFVWKCSLLRYDFHCQRLRVELAVCITATDR